MKIKGLSRVSFGVALAALAAAGLTSSTTRADVVTTVAVTYTTNSIPGGTTAQLFFGSEANSPSADPVTMNTSNYAFQYVNYVPGTAGTQGSATQTAQASGPPNFAIPADTTATNGGYFNVTYVTPPQGSSNVISFLLTFTGKAISNPTPGAPDNQFFVQLVNPNNLNSYSGAPDLLDVTILGGEAGSNAGQAVISNTSPGVTYTATGPIAQGASVPEPSSLITGGLCASVGLGVYLRKRRASAPPVSAG